jgi:hypothetical protein
MGNLAFQDVDLLLSDMKRSAPNREFLGLPQPMNWTAFASS